MSDEVSDFLRSVEQLKDRRDEEDEARSRELEEKILQDKRERQARRAERARSISPQKSSPANTPPPYHHRHNSSQVSEGVNLTSSPPALGSPRSPRRTQTSESMASADFSISPTKENDSPFDAETKRESVASPTTGMPTRTPTLSWQRRPTSQASERPKSRPLSMVAAENAAARSGNVSPEHAEPPTSRDQIAQALAGKDPTWFRQTADRGQNSPAYRKNQVEDDDRLDMSAMRSQLPGMSRALPTEPAKEPLATIDSPSRTLGSPLNLSAAQRLPPPIDNAADDSVASPRESQGLMSPPSGRTSPTRPLSPTKGMGGFVQSAMMKRTDSVKRWSVNSPAGLQRADSVVSNRNSIDNTHRSGTSPSRPGSRSKESTPRPSSRPTSSHDQEPAAVSTPTATQESAEPKQEEPERTTPPTSPSKTMDPRRWSPTKSSSWLEAALNKPESPKPKPTTPASNQPAWMVALNEAKAQKASGASDLGRGGSVRKHEVKTGGLLRSSPMGTISKLHSVGTAPSSLHSPSLSTSSDKTVQPSFRSSLSKTTSSGAAGSDSKEVDKSATAQGSPSVKPKPETPPKKDFHSSIKPRPPPATNSNQPAEFKNVFGTLRKTETKNYVAPDIFKDNITRGKNALNITGGPKPREKKDELKEAILQKKAEFNKAKAEGHGIATNTYKSTDKPIPEGLAKKLELGRSSTVSLPSKRDSATSQRSVDLTSRTFGSNRSSTISQKSAKDSDPTSPPPAAGPASPPVVSMQPKDTGLASRFQKQGGGSLANRFNPNLANLLARGPPPMASGSPDDSEKPSGTGQATSSQEPAAPGPQLTHMTKNRARGPRRKAPTSAPTQAAVETEKASSPPIARSLPQPKADPIPQPKPALPSNAFKLPGFDFEKASSTAAAAPEPKPSASNVINLVDSSKRFSSEETSRPAGKPISLVGSSTTSTTTRPRSPTKIHDQIAAIAAKSQQTATGETSQPASPTKKLDMKRMSKFLDEGQQMSPVDLTPRPLSPSKTGGDRPLQPRPLSPQKTGGRALPEAPRPLSPQKTGGRALPEAPKREQSSPIKEFSQSRPLPSASGASRGEGPFSPRPFPNAPVLAPKPTSPPVKPKPASLPMNTGPMSPPLPSSPMRSPTKYALEVTGMLNDFFGENRPQRDYRADTAEILMKRPQLDTNIKTQSAQLFRLTPDGKKFPVPEPPERVLFEREMYLCTHTFVNGVGKKLTEVYFWAGDEVPQSMAEDAQIFVNREARASSTGKAILLQQGKESAGFVAALGGILIVRRGSSNKYDSLAPSLLCGRRYMGAIAFDEVDFSPNSLCSGFPYLITQQGKCFLWKGKGSDVDELSCARLIGMDLALMGELTEVDEGSEPTGFWDIFQGGSKSGSADHWRLKPNYDKYCGRLFCSDATSRQQITELHPFSQSSLSPNSIYILDAFFEMYVVVGSRAQSQYPAFHNALEFAQEYAILASGMEDRPFVPVSTVVLEGIPRDMKSVFRKWRDEAGPTRLNVAAGGGAPGSPSGLRRGRSLRVVPLTQALQALRD